MQILSVGRSARSPRWTALSSAAVFCHLASPDTNSSSRVLGPHSPPSYSPHKLHFPAASPTPIAPSPLSPSPVIPGRPKPSSPAHEPPLLTPPSHLSKRAECEVLTGEGSRLRNRSLDQSLGRRLFDETGSPEQQLQPKDTPTGSFELVEKRFMDSGRSQWVFLNAEETEDEGGNRVAGKACHARVRKPRVRMHTTRAERRWHTLLARALSAASQPPLTPGHAPPQCHSRFHSCVLALRVPHQAVWRLFSAGLRACGLSHLLLCDLRSLSSSSCLHRWGWYALISTRAS